MNPDDIDPDDEVLLHYGVKGMKWGVRKDGKPQGYQGKSPGKAARVANRAGLTAGVIAGTTAVVAGAPIGAAAGVAGALAVEGVRAVATKNRYHPRAMAVTDTRNREWVVTHVAASADPNSPEPSRKQIDRLAKTTSDISNKVITGNTVRREMDRINAKYEPLWDGKPETKTSYNQEVNSLLKFELDKALPDQLEAFVDIGLDGLDISVSHVNAEKYIDWPDKAKHEDNDSEESYSDRASAKAKVVVVRNDIGLITSLNFGGGLDHEGIDPDEEILLHYGIIGMRWGVRKDRRTGQRSGSPVAGTKAAKHSSPSVNPDVQKKRNDIRDQYLNLTPEQEEKKSLGIITDNDISTGQLREAAERLRLTNEINRLLKDAVPDTPDGTKAMQEAVNRIKLEQEYKKLTAAPPKKKGPLAAAASSLLMGVGKKQLENVLNTAIKTKADSWMVSQGLKPKGDSKKKNSNNSGKGSGGNNTTTNTTTNNFFNFTPPSSKPAPFDMGNATVVPSGPLEIERRKRR